MEGDELSEEELEQIREYLSIVDNCDYSKEALYEFMDINGYDHDAMYIASEDCYEGLAAISGKDVKAYVEAKTGITDFDLSVLDGYTYVESEDVLFGFVDPFICEDDIICIDGVRNGNLVQVDIHFESQFYSDKRLTLIETGDSGNPYLFYSSMQLLIWILRPRMDHYSE